MRVNKITGGLSITMVGKKYLEKCIWRFGDQMSNSDHLPITTTIHSITVHQPVLGTEAKWKKPNIDWSAYQAAVERSMTSLEQCQT